MKQRTLFFRMVMFLSLAATSVKAQIQNGNFYNGFTSWQMAASTCHSLNPTASLVGDMTGCPKIETITNNGRTYWVDLTGCGFGNGRWLSQQVPTTAGKTYLLQWELGCANDIRKIDAGVDLAINGVTVPGRFENADFTANDYGPDYCTWKQCRHCFTATQNTTELKFTANAAGTASTPPWARTNDSMRLNYEHPKVIGFDNVEMICIDDLFRLNVKPENTCNRFCLSLAMQTNSLVTYSDVKWYVDDELESNGDTYCRYFPQGRARQVKVEFTVITPCGLYTKTLQTTVTATDHCPCTGLQYAFTSCNSVNFNVTTNPGFNLADTDWTLDGISVPGSPGALLLNSLPPGPHTVCLKTRVTLPPEADTLDCNEECVVIVVPPPPVETVRTFTYCSYSDPVGPRYFPCIECSTFEYLENGQIIGTDEDGCGPYLIKPTSELRCYTVLPGGYRCLSEIARFHVQVMDQVQQLPDEIVYLPCQGPPTGLNFPITCGSRYELSGPGGYQLQGSTPAVVTLPPGLYSYTCYDHTSCTKSIRNLYVLEKIMTREQLPHLVISAPCGKEEVAYNPHCGLDYEIYGPNGYYSRTLHNSPYEPVLGPGTYTVLCTDLENCITYSRLLDVNPGPPLVVSYLPDETRTIPCGSNSMVYDPYCGPEFEIYGPGGFFISSTVMITLPQLSAGDYTVRCNDPVNCRTYVKIVHVLQTPMPVIRNESVVLYIPCGLVNVIYAPVCTTSYSITGSNGFTMQGSYPFVGLPVLPAGNYTIHCIDPENCILHETIVDVREPLISESNCQVSVPEGSCITNMFDPQSAHYFEKYMDSCPDCKTTVEHATVAGPWKTTAITLVPGRVIRTLTREYYDAVNCKKCTITLQDPLPATPGTYFMAEGEECHTFDLPACLQNTTFKMFVNGFPDDLITISGQTDIELCCDNAHHIPDPTYVMYSEEDPCCAYFIDLFCHGWERPQRTPAGLSADGEAKTRQVLTLVPNPASSVFRIISGEQQLQFKKVEITDLSGKTVLTATDLDSGTSIDAGKLAKGAYIIHVTTDSGTSRLKLVLINKE